MLRDPLGRQSTIDAGVDLATGVLPKGEQDFEYVAGAIRDDSSGVPVYGEAGGVAKHRVGVTDWFTVGVTAEGSKDVLAAGPNVSLRLGRLGELEVHTAASRLFNPDVPSHLPGLTETIDGFATYGIYNFISRWVSISALAQYYDDGYANLWQLPGDIDTPEFYQASAGVPLFRTSSLTYTWTRPSDRRPATSASRCRTARTIRRSSWSVAHSLRLSGRVLPRTQLSV